MNMRREAKVLHIKINLKKLNAVLPIFQLLFFFYLLFRSRVGKWMLPLGVWWAWLLFPALPEEYRSAITLGIWHKPDVGTKTQDYQ